MKLWFKHLGILAIIAAVSGLSVMVSGIIPISASGGHWPVTRRVLEFSMSRSVSTHSMGIEAPDLSDRALITKGAGHFETGCVQCHGSPLRRPSPIAAALTPHPPVLADAVLSWSAGELFYIVKHGVKMTGMPAWPAQDRDDEVWAVVAFLSVLPDMHNDEYQSLVYGGSRSVDDSIPTGLHHLATTTCGRCHGADGLGGPDRVFPVLAGQRKEYLAATLRAYASGERYSGIMQPLAVPLQEMQIEELADFYSELPSRLGNSWAAERDESDLRNRSATKPDEEITGANIVEVGIPSRRVPACAGCHGPEIGGKYPLLSGQPTAYLEQQLNLFKRRVRGGTSNAHLMHPVTERITDAQIKAVAEYYGSPSPDVSDIETHVSEAPEE